MPKKDIKITENDLILIYGNDYDFFCKEILPNCFCDKCCVGGGKPMVGIVDYEIFLNDLNNVALKGKCAECGHSIGRYLETGEVKEYAANIDKVKKLYKKSL